MNLYGASGHAKVIIDIIRSRNEELHLIFDDDPAITQLMGEKVINEPARGTMEGRTSIVAIGNNRTRKKVAAKIGGDFHPFMAHASAVVSSSARIGAGTVIMANATVNPEARIGEHCIINSGAVVEHDVNLGDFVHISPNASIAGNVKIGEGSHIGTGACIIPGISIGRWVTVGAGAVIIKDIPEFAVVVGNPGKIVRISAEITE